MNTFKPGGGFKRGGGGRSFNDKPKFGGGSNRGGGGDRKSFGDRPRRDGDSGGGQKFSATCAECHKSCEVPFRPSNDKPVYCSECFGKQLSHTKNAGHGGDRGPARSERRPAPAPARDDAKIEQRLLMIEGKLQRIFDLLSQAKDEPVTVVAPKKAVVNTTDLKKAVAKAVKTPAKKVVKKAEKKPVVKKVVKKTTKK